MSLPLACRKCNRNCLKMHGKSRNDPSMHPSFFKIMFGNKFDEHLVLPPAFAKKFMSHENKQITLQDANRRHWDVMLTKVNGSLAFQKGWNYFVMDHNIEYGDLLVFDYFKDAHFIVDIFGKSGCPKKLAAVTTNNGTGESYRSSIPTKRSSESSYKQSAPKKPKTVHVGKNHVEPRSSSSPEKSRPNDAGTTNKHGTGGSYRSSIPTKRSAESFYKQSAPKKPKTVHVGKNHVEPRSSSSPDKSSPDVAGTTNNHGTGESYRSSIPTKRSSESFYKPPAPEMPKNVHVEPRSMSSPDKSRPNVAGTTNKHGTGESYRSSIPTKRSSESSYKPSAPEMPKNVHVAKTHVEPRSMSSPDKSSPDVAGTTNKHGTGESYRSSIPTKRSSESYKPSAPEMPKNVDVAKTHVEPHSMTTPDKSRPNVVPVAPSRGKSKPHVDPLPEILAKSRFMSNRAKSRPETSVEPCLMSSREKAIPDVVSETFVDPCFMSSRDQSKPKSASVTESIVEPCFMTSREKNVTAEYDREVLFDLSAFEMPVKKPMKQETDCHPDFSAYDSPVIETNAYTTGELHPQGDIFSQLSDISRNTAMGMADNLSISELNPGNLMSSIHTETVKASHQASLRNHEFAPLSSSSPDGDLYLHYLDSLMPSKIIGTPETSEFPAFSDGISRLNNQEEKVCKQEICGDAGGSCFLDTSLSISEPTQGDLAESSVHTVNAEGGDVKLVKQESRNVEQDICGGEMVDGCSGEDFCVAELTKIICGDITENDDPTVKVKDDVNGIVEVEVVECDAPSATVTAIVDVESVACDTPSATANAIMEVESVACDAPSATVNAIVNVEPVDCVAPSATVAKVACLVPPHSNFLELPITFSVAERVRRGRSTKETSQLVFLRDNAGRHWPVVYHNNKGLKVLTTGWKAFMKANYIERGDECVFTVENSEEHKFIVEVVPHN